MTKLQTTEECVDCSKTHTTTQTDGVQEDERFGHGRGKNYKLTNGPWLTCPTFLFWPRPKHQTVLWITGHVVHYIITRRRALKLLDYMDFMGRSRWRKRQRTSGNYLSDWLRPCRWPRGLRRRSAATRWDCGFESHRRRVCLLWVLCVVRERSLRRADRSPRGVLSSVCVCVTECDQVQQ